MKCEACNGKGAVVRYMEFPLADEHLICQRCGGSGEVYMDERKTHSSRSVGVM